MPFRDRRHAGQLLALLLDHHRGEDVLVLALPRGGVPVAFEVALRLSAPLDVMVARKVGAPAYPEFGVGAVAPGGIFVLDEEAVAAVGATRAEVDQVAHDEIQEMDRRLLVYRGEARPPDVRGRIVILVDDGLATGVTARAALRSLRLGDPRRLVLAVPVGAPDSVAALRREADDVVCVETPSDFRAVGLWYDDFRQTEDEEVLALLEDVALADEALEERGHRAIGVVYDPEAEAWGNYVPTVLPRRYDAFLFVDRSRALAPLPVRAVSGEVPETYPFGQ